MSDTFETLFTQKAARRVCRVAYTLNNRQPVACTIIGDQPLFYMDYDGAYEDDAFLDDADFDLLENELSTLRKEIETFDKFSSGFLNFESNNIEEFFENADDMFKPASPQNHDINELTAILAKSRLAKAYLDIAAKYQIDIAYNTHIENSAYDRKNSKILINPALKQADQILVAVRELRKHFQHRQGALIHPLMFHPDNAILVNRAQIADLAVSMIRVAWELQLADIKEVWQRIENSSIADLGRAFAREAYLDFRTINNGEACAAVFEAWFLSERCRANDKALIQQMLADYQGFVFENGDVVTNITPTLIAALGEMPFGKNYLAEHAPVILSDTIFSDVRDRSSANFLWFIKFERSFRESEASLQHQFRPAASDKRAGPSVSISGDESGKSAEIITLFADNDDGDNRNNSTKALSPKRPSKRMNNKGADIVYIRRWSADS